MAHPAIRSKKLTSGWRKGSTAEPDADNWISSGDLLSPDQDIRSLFYWGLVSIVYHLADKKDCHILSAEDDESYFTYGYGSLPGGGSLVWSRDTKDNSNQ